jgi:hypothetical protein
VTVAKPAPLARREQLVRKVRRARPVHRDRQGMPVNAAKLDRKALRVRPAQQDHPDRRAIWAQHLHSASSPAQTTRAAQTTRS